MRRIDRFVLPFALVVAASGCASDKPAEQQQPAAQAVKAEAPAQKQLATVERLQFNRRAAELFLPLFWVADNGDGQIGSDELATLWGFGDGTRSTWVNADGSFTQAFIDAEKAIAQQHEPTRCTTPSLPDEVARVEALRLELAQGRPTLVSNNFATGSAEDKAIVQAIFDAAAIVERIHAKQQGTDGLGGEMEKQDATSRMVFFRNQGAQCVAPKTENDAACAALPNKPKRVVGIYPAEIQTVADFCTALEKRKDAETLMHQFVVVKAKAPLAAPVDISKASLEAVPYHIAYQAEMTQVAALLEQAAQAIVSPSETAFQTYLRAAATSFKTGDFQPADEAWSKMNAENSKWYLRIGPDETYWEPCSRKAGFHVSFARINQDSLAWQKKLEPVKTDMENALASLAGKPYVARNVTFHLPDFIDIVLNAADSRDALGATIGQSLPNWGPVANEGRGRTVAMTNLYTDKDSEDAWRMTTSSLLCSDTMKKTTFDQKLAVMSTVLHEAAHNLGPAHEYKVKGKTDDQIFGGPMASMLEELKSQTAALYFSEWLVDKKLVTPAEAEGAHLRDITWAFGHIAQGMYNAEGKPKAYSQLAAIQMGALVKAQALVWKADAMAANGSDKGCFDVDQAKWRPAIDALAKRVLHVKGAGDKADAEKLKAEFVDKKDDFAKLKDIIAERWLRAPKASFVYSVTL